MSFLEGSSPLDKTGKDAALTDFDRKVAQAINNPGVHMLLMQPFMEYVTQYQALNQVPIPISQIFGFSQFTVQAAARINTSQNTTSTSYVDLGTVGPILSGLADGQYLFLGGAAAAQATAGAALLNFSVNGATPADDNDAAQAGVANAGFSVATAVVITLDTGGNNTVKLVYRSSDGNTSSFNRRWLVALKFDN